jgi:predicted ester cyclase
VNKEVLQMELIKPTQSNSDTEHNMAVVRCYFDQLLGDKKVAIADQVFTSDAVMHRPGTPVTGIDNVKKLLAVMPSRYYEFKTSYLDMIATGDRVAVRLKHDVIFSKDVILPFRTGKYPVGGMPLNWTAHTYFRFKEGKIAEEWVERDELGMLLSLGILKPQQ